MTADEIKTIKMAVDEVAPGVWDRLNDIGGRFGSQVWPPSTFMWLLETADPGLDLPTLRHLVVWQLVGDDEVACSFLAASRHCLPGLDPIREKYGVKLSDADDDARDTADADNYALSENADLAILSRLTGRSIADLADSAVRTGVAAALKAARDRAELTIGYSQHEPF